MNIRRLAGLAAVALLLAFAGSADAGDTILAVTGEIDSGEMRLTLAEIGARGTTDGNVMEMTDKGLFHSRSVWQIHRIEIE